MSKTKRVKKRNKKFSRKNVHKGGDTSDDFVLVGFEKNNEPYRNPVFLPINCNLREPNLPIIPYQYLTSQMKERFDMIGVNYGFLNIRPFPQILILPQLYKLKNFRNIDLFGDLFSVGIQQLWNKNNGDIALVGTDYFSTISNENYINTFKNAIIKIELDYPGLFKPIFIDKDLTEDEIRNLTNDQKQDIEDKAKDKVYKLEV
jgi:hypothetical protein